MKMQSFMLFRQANGLRLGGAVIALILLLLGVSPVIAQKAPLVVTTITPVTALVHGVAGNQLDIVQLDLGGSPHGGSLKASQMRLLKQAALLVYIDPLFEVALQKPISSLSMPMLRLSRIDDLTRLTQRNKSANGDHTHSHGQEHSQQGHARLDMHLWLDPSNAKAMTAAIETVLSQHFPDKRHIFKRNTQRLLTQITHLDARLREAFVPAAVTAFMVHHDSTQYLEKHYGLNGLGAALGDPHQPPSVKAIRHAREQVREAGVACVFSEKAFNAKQLNAVVEDSHADIVEIDPLGLSMSAQNNTQPISPNPYIIMMEALAGNMLACLMRENE